MGNVPDLREPLLMMREEIERVDQGARFHCLSMRYLTKQQFVVTQSEPSAAEERQRQGGFATA